MKYLSQVQHFNKLLVKLVVAVIRRLPPTLKFKIVQNRFYKLLDKTSYKNTRLQRFYLDQKLDPIQFLNILNQRKLEYVLLRSWENLPEYPAGEDINILITDEHRDLLQDLVNRDSRGIKCDIYTVSGAKNGNRFGIPVFPYKLSMDLLRNRVFYKNAFVPSPFEYFASVAYHAVLHKAHESGVPGFDLKPTNCVYDYTTVLKNLRDRLGITNVDINVTGLYNWLKKERYAPAEDTLSKLVEISPELNILQSRLYSDVRGGELLVYILRERLLQEGLLEKFKEFLNQRFCFDLLDVRLLNEEEKKICAREIRGGEWDEGPYKSSGGPPAALVVAFDNHPRPLNSIEAKKQTRMTNRNNIDAKYQFRKVINSSLWRDSYNGIHSSDNEHDAWFYISRIGKDYREKIISQVENKREILRRRRSERINTQRMHGRIDFKGSLV